MSAARVSQATVKALIASEKSEESTMQKLIFELEETYPNSRSTSAHTAVVLLPGESKVVTLVNSLTRDRTQLIRIKVRTVKVMVSYFFVCLLLSYLATKLVGILWKSQQHPVHGYMIRLSLLLRIHGLLSKLY